jgi:hypothetical protein
MAKKYFKLPGYYEGLTAKRIEQSGRLWFVRVCNDPPPYWLVIIRGFKRERDKASGATSIGVWRFTDEAAAKAKFDELRQHYPPYSVRVPTERQLRARRRFAEKAKLGGIRHGRMPIPAAADGQKARGKDNREQRRCADGCERHLNFASKREAAA